MRVLEANCVTILPTNRCTARCRHCSMNAGPERRDTLSWEQLDRIINQLFDELPHLEVVVFSGGESTLLGEDLHRALRLCKQRSARVVTRLVTNAHWAHSPEAAYQTLRALRDAGLDELNISTDDYHLPFISLQKVRYAWDAARRIDFLSLALSNAYGPQSWLTPERLDAEFGESGPLQKRFGPDGFGLEREFHWDRTNVLLSNMMLNHLGRGNTAVAEDETEHMGQRLADIGDLLSGCPWAVRSAAISAKGHFVACCGFEVEDNPILDYGDLNQRPLKELLDKADNDLISNMIAIIGPPQLKRLLEQIAPGEVSFPRKDYASYCEVCEDLVGIEKNRRALYKYQALFYDTVVDIREQYRQQFGDGERVRIPAGVRYQYRFDLGAPDDPKWESAVPRRTDPHDPPLIPTSRLVHSARAARPDPAPPAGPATCPGR